MLVRRGKAGLWTAAICAAVLAVPALAANKTVSAPLTPDDRFSSATLTIDQGDTLTFQNQNPEDHNLKASKPGRFGGRLFASRSVVAFGQSAPVAGTQYLTTSPPGSPYTFVCTFHADEGMTGTLTVTSSGTPVPLPGLSMRILSGDLAAVRSSGKLPIRVRSAGAGRARVVAKLGSTRLGTKVLHFDGPGTHRPKIALTDAGSEALAGRDHARITVRGTVVDALGTTGGGRVSRTLF
jgi:plastocyanin